MKIYRSIIIVLIGIFSLNTSVLSQNIAYKASVNQQGIIQLEELHNVVETNEKFSLQPKPGFPFGAPANPTFKNFRGAAIADINNDGADEIVFGANSTLFAINGNGDILWSRILSGTIIYPPSIVDMNGDESLEIIVNTGGSPNAGRVYLLDNEANDLPGWPQNFDQHWMFNAPTISDLNGDDVMEVVTCERGNSTSGFLHIIKFDGSPLNENWPLELPGNLAFTPSIGDIDNNGTKDIVISISSGSLYAINIDGSYLDGFPLVESNKSFSYQSPILYDFDDNGTLEIVGARHGNQSDYYMVESNGSYTSGWPITNPTDWRYSPATVVSSINENEDAGIFFGHPNTNGSIPMDVIYGFNSDGSPLDGFPISKIGGCESVISVADINEDGMQDLIFTNNSTDAFGKGYIHAYSIDGSGELEGFPLRPKGFTFMNSAVFGDIDGDDYLDIACLSYTQFTGSDSIFITAYNLGVPVENTDIVFNGYKGNLYRDGIIHESTGVGIHHPLVENLWLEVSPNPSASFIKVRYPSTNDLIKLSISNYLGQLIQSYQFIGQHEIQLSTESLKTGVYFINLEIKGEIISRKWIKI